MKPSLLVHLQAEAERRGIRTECGRRLVDADVGRGEVSDELGALPALRRS